LKFTRNKYEHQLKVLRIAMGQVLAGSGTSWFLLRGFGSETVFDVLENKILISLGNLFIEKKSKQYF
jgi:hypothetical protein